MQIGVTKDGAKTIVPVRKSVFKWSNKTKILYEIDIASGKKKMHEFNFTFESGISGQVLGNQYFVFGEKKSVVMDLETKHVKELKGSTRKNHSFFQSASVVVNNMLIYIIGGRGNSNHVEYLDMENHMKFT